MRSDQLKPKKISFPLTVVICLVSYPLSSLFPLSFFRLSHFSPLSVHFAVRPKIVTPHRTTPPRDRHISSHLISLDAVMSCHLMSPPLSLFLVLVFCRLLSSLVSSRVNTPHSHSASVVHIRFFCRFRMRNFCFRPPKLLVSFSVCGFVIWLGFE